MAEKKPLKTIYIKKNSLQPLVLAGYKPGVNIGSPQKNQPKLVFLKNQNDFNSAGQQGLRIVNTGAMTGQKVIILKNDQMKNLFRANEHTAKINITSPTKTKVVYIQKQPSSECVLSSSVKPKPKQIVIKDFKVTSDASKPAPKVITIKNEAADEVLAQSPKRYINLKPISVVSPSDVQHIPKKEDGVTMQDASQKQHRLTMQHVAKKQHGHGTTVLHVANKQGGPTRQYVAIKENDLTKQRVPKRQNMIFAQMLQETQESSVKEELKMEQVVEELVQDECEDEYVEEQVMLDDGDTGVVTLQQDGDRWTATERARTDAEMYHEVILTEPSAEYVCRICNVLFETEQLKEEHMTQEHTFMYECTQCNHRTINANAARAHFREEHQAHLVYAEHEGDEGEGVVVQEQDGGWGETEDFVAAEVLLQQEQMGESSVDSDAPQQCPYCFKSYSKGRAFRTHIRKHEAGEASAAEAMNSDQPYCDECDLLFPSQVEWTKHVLTSKKHRDKKRMIHNGCRQCGQTFRSPNDLRAHNEEAHPNSKVRVRSWKEPQPCALCGDMMESSHKYWSHFRRVHPGEKYPLRQQCQQKCEECGSQFRCRALLKMHMNKHTGLRMYRCAECPKTFFTNLSLRYHQISHSELRPFKCETCGRGFKFKAGLDRHQLVHTGERPYVCGVCGQGFTTMHWTQLHVRKVHNNEHIPYKPRVRKRKPAGTVKQQPEKLSEESN